MSSRLARLFRFGTVLTATSIVLAACAPPAVQQAKPAAPAAATEAPVKSPAETEGEITVYTVPGAPQKVLEAMQKDFNAKYPKVNIKINVHGSGDFADAMFAKGAANNLEDIIFNADLYVPPFVDADLLVDMEALEIGRAHV